jgi:hypothetical protein
MEDEENIISSSDDEQSCSYRRVCQLPQKLSIDGYMGFQSSPRKSEPDDFFTEIEDWDHIWVKLAQNSSLMQMSHKSFLANYQKDPVVRK